jgi:hypothetical protein
VAKTDLGVKQTCPDCGTKFYDLGRRPCVCPKCCVEFDGVDLEDLNAEANAPNDPPADESVEAGGVSSPSVSVRLLQDVSVCEALGVFTVLFREGEPLPATANIKVNYSPADGANNSISLFAGERPLAAAIYKSGKPTKKEVARILDVTVVLDEHGNFSARAVPANETGQFLVFCATVDTPFTTVYPATDGVVVDIPDIKNEPVHSRALSQTVADRTANTLNAYAGFTVDGEVLECLFEPMETLPASVVIKPDWVDDDERRLGVLLIDVIDLDEEELEELDETSTLTLIDDDRHNAICFEVPEGVERLKLTVRPGGEFTLEALREEGLVELTGELGFLPTAPESGEVHASSSAAQNDTAEREVVRQESDDLDASSPADKDDNAAERQMDGLLSPLTEPQDSSRLFVSHHTDRDGKFALWLVDQLESRGVQCWICSRDIEPGADWHRSVMKAVRECGTMVVVVSPASVESDFVQAEVSRALKLKKRVVPLLLDDELPYWDIDARLENKQRIDWWKVGEAGISVLSASV